MLRILNLRKSYLKNRGIHPVLKGVNLTLSQGERVAILGQNGAGKSTLIRLIGGIEEADEGYIQSSMSISWPLGYTGGMQGSLTGLDNILFLCKIYDVQPHGIVEYIEDFTELGSFLNEPVKTYSTGMRGRLNFALSMAFNFDCLLIDEGLSAGDMRFAERTRLALLKKKQQSILMVSHSMESILDFCDTGYVLEDGVLVSFSSLSEAIQYYRHTLNLANSS